MLFHRERERESRNTPCKGNWPPMRNKGRRRSSYLNSQALLSKNASCLQSKSQKKKKKFSCQLTQSSIISTTELGITTKMRNRENKRPELVNTTNTWAILTERGLYGNSESPTCSSELLINTETSNSRRNFPVKYLTREHHQHHCHNDLS